LKKKVTKTVTNNLRKDNLIENKNYLKLLEIMGLSPKPLSPYELQKEFTRIYKIINQDKKITDSKKGSTTIWRKKHNQYIFKMIKNLRPNLVDNYYTYFFNWDEIINDESQKKQVLKYIKEKFRIDLIIFGNPFEEKDILPLFTKSKDNKIINIENQSKHRQVSIQKTRYNNAEIILNENNEKKSLSLNVKNNTEVYVPTKSFDEPFATFMNTFYWKRPFFLDIIYTAKIKKRELKDNQISKKSHVDLTPLNYENETIDIIKNGYTIRRPLKDYISKEEYEFRKNHSKSQPRTNLERAERSIKIEKYFLNTRGLILYILGKTTPNKNENKNKSSLNQKEVLRNREKYRKNISDVLSNLSENYSSNFPFLLYYKKFREILKDVMKNHQYFQYYDVDILITIAEDLESQIWLDDKYTNLNIDSNNNALLNYWIVKRYSAEVTHYLAYFCKYLKEDSKEEFLSMFREYQKKMITIMLEYLKDEQKLVQHLLDEFNHKGLLIL
jgi:hypothetical protein